MKNNMPLKLIIFDLDGTLIDSIRDIAEAVNYTLKQHGFNTLSEDSVKIMVGDGVSTLIAKATNYDENIDKQKALDVFLNYYENHLVDYTKPYTNVVKTLKLLKGYKKAVITNKKSSLSRIILDKLELMQHFDLLLGPEDVKEKKPSAEPLLKAMETLKVQPSETVIIGDSSVDIEAGKAAGVKTIAAAYGFRPVETLKDADFIIHNDISELISILNAISGGVSQPQS
ncbi:phosphoglycolate phosphatase, bacterial [Candidatus Magnetoovum chiemensis]|nr:phosphoglycolate phosphatase, bacterial [Candidatus Magnetoovum chiemensis]